jgi:conjugal transfer pilus assembly protein TraW
MSKTTLTTLSSLLFLLMIFVPVLAKDLGRFGAVYPIIEPDALEEIRARAAQVDWKKVFNREKMTRKVREYRPDNLVKLPAASHSRTFLTDMSHTLDMDIPDGKGGVLYPKGYTFNPLDYIKLTRILVIINGNDKKQVEWFRTSPWNKDLNAMLLLTEGGYFKLGDRLKRPVFYADRLMVTKLGLKAVPSVAVQKGRMMEVREYEVR